MGSVKQTLLATTPPITSFVMDLLAPFKHLIDNYDLGDMLKETARLYYNNNSINVNPFGSIFEAVVLAATLVALLSYLIEVKVEKSDDYGLETRSDAEYQPYIHKLQRQVSQLEEVADLQEVLDERGINLVQEKTNLNLPFISRPVTGHWYLDTSLSWYIPSPTASFLFASYAGLMVRSSSTTSFSFSMWEAHPC